MDDLWIDLPPDETVEALSVVLARLPGVSVLWLYAVAEADDPVSVMASACAEAAEASTFAEICAKGIEGACRIADAEHSLLLQALGDGALGVIASTAPHLSGVASNEPCLAREAAAVGLPLGSQGSTSWGPPSWRAAASAASVAAVPLFSVEGSVVACILLLREKAIVFQPEELERLENYGKVLCALLRRQTEMSAPRPEAWHARESPTMPARVG